MPDRIWHISKQNKLFWCSSARRDIYFGFCNTVFRVHLEFQRSLFRKEWKILCQILQITSEQQTRKYLKWQVWPWFSTNKWAAGELTGFTNWIVWANFDWDWLDTKILAWVQNEKGNRKKRERRKTNYLTCLTYPYNKKNSFQ